jgi:acyl-CoA thioesterase
VNSDLAQDTTPRAIGASLYAVDLPPAWNFKDPSGGVLLTAVLRAAQVELAAPELRVRSATAVFASVIFAGPIHIEINVVRKGGAVAQVRGRLYNAGSAEPGMDVLAVFARDRNEGPEFVDATPPVVTRPLDCPLLVRPTPVRSEMSPPIFEQIEVRLAQGNAWWDRDFESGPAQVARWMRYGTPQRLANGQSDPLCLPPMVDTMPPSAIQRLGGGFTPFLAPSLDLTVHFLAPTDTEWFLLDTHTRIAGGGYASADVHVWDERGTLVGFGTQMWMFRKVPPNVIP